MREEKELKTREGRESDEEGEGQEGEAKMGKERGRKETTEWDKSVGRSHEFDWFGGIKCWLTWEITRS